MTRAASQVVVRDAHAADEPFLWRVLSLTADPLRNEPPAVDAVRADPGLSPYVAGWGRPGDTAILAEVDGAAVGAAWYRRYPADAPGYGFVVADIPEISMGVEEAWRSRGIGRALLAALIDRAGEAGIEALSLSVDGRNTPAIGLYRSIGFETVAGDAVHPTMLLRLLG